MTLRLRGLPFDVTEKDIAQFLAPYKILEGSIKIGLNATGQRTGEAVVQFKSPEEAKKAYLEKQGDNIGHRWIELYLIKTSQYIIFELRHLSFVTCDHSQEKKVSTMNIGKYLNKDNKSKAVKLRGLPFNAMEDEIIEFFKKYNIVKTGPEWSRRKAASSLRGRMGRSRATLWFSCRTRPRR